MKPVWLILWAITGQALSGASNGTESLITSLRMARRPIRIRPEDGWRTCNHDIKKSFNSKTLDYFESLPFKAVGTIHEICPTLQLSCCSAKEVSNMYDHANSYIDIIRLYFHKTEKFYQMVKQIDTRRFLENFRLLYKRKGKTPEDFLPEMEKDILNMDLLAQKALIKYQRISHIIQHHYLGFLCTMCNYEQQRYFRMVGKDLQLEVDPTFCQNIFLRKNMVYEVSEIMLRFYAIASKISHLYTKVEVQESALENLRLSVKRKLGETSPCLDPDKTTLSSLTDPKCIGYCRQKFRIGMFVMTFDFASMAKFCSEIFFNFSQGIFTLPGDSGDSLGALVDSLNTPYIFKRYFTIWPATVNNIYTSKRYGISLSYAGLNFVDNNPKTPEENIYSGTMYMEFLMGSSGRLMAVLAGLLGLLVLPGRL